MDCCLFTSYIYHKETKCFFHCITTQLDGCELHANPQINARFIYAPLMVIRLCFNSYPCAPQQSSSDNAPKHSIVPLLSADHQSSVPYKLINTHFILASVCKSAMVKKITCIQISVGYLYQPYSNNANNINNPSCRMKFNGKLIVCIIQAAYFELQNI